MFLRTWLSSAWNARVLGGRGVSAIPYLHVRDVVSFFRTLLDQIPRLEPGAVVVASPDGAVSHRQLFDVATRIYYGKPRRPLLMPRPLCGPGMHARDLFGRLTGERPFERPWMAKYIDESLTIDARRTRERLGWAPRPRLEILNRIAFLIENLRSDPVEWNRRNRAAMKIVRLEPNLKIHWLLERHEAEIAEEFQRRLLGPDGRERFPSYQTLDREEVMWNVKLALRHLMNAIRTGEKSIVGAYSADLAEHRFHQGYNADEVCAAWELLNWVCFKVLRKDRESDDLVPFLGEYITMPLRFGCDTAQETFDELKETSALRARRGASGR
jgi:hypothetical protein